MMFLKSCPKCLGAIAAERDHYGKYLYCLHCGWQRDLNETLDTVARNPQVRPLRRSKQMAVSGQTPNPL